MVCLLSALCIHGIGTQAPFEVWLATLMNLPLPHFDQPAIRPVRMSGLALAEGIEEQRIEGVTVRAFDAAKTVADCNYSNKFGTDVALEARRDGCAQGKLRIDDLWRYTTIDRMPTSSARIRPSFGRPNDRAH